MSTLVGVLWFVVFLVIATVAVLAVTLVSVVLVALGLLLSPALALVLGVLLLLKRSKPARSETRPSVAAEGQGPSPIGRATEQSPPASAEAPAAAVKRAA